jgi:pimeloyl-ACP methyl ester carboxylesterase
MRLFESSTYDGIPYEELAEIKNLRKTTPGLYAEQDAVDHIFSEADETRLPAEITAEVLSRFLRVREELQTDLVALSIKSEQRTCADAGHYIHYARPDAVIQAILDVLAATRESGR